MQTRCTLYAGNVTTDLKASQAGDGTTGSWMMHLYHATYQPMNYPQQQAEVTRWMMIIVMRQETCIIDPLPEMHETQVPKLKQLCMPGGRHICG